MSFANNFAAKNLIILLLHIYEKGVAANQDSVDVFSFIAPAIPDYVEEGNAKQHFSIIYRAFVYLYSARADLRKEEYRSAGPIEFLAYLMEKSMPENGGMLVEATSFAYDPCIIKEWAFMQIMRDLLLEIEVMIEDNSMVPLLLKKQKAISTVKA